VDKRTKGCLLIGLGVLLLLVVVGIAVIAGAGYLFSRQFSVETRQHTREDAWKEMDEVRARFGDRQPFIVTDADRPGLRPDAEPAAPGTAPSIQSLHAMAYDADDRELVRVTIPFWVLRLAPDGKLSASNDALRGLKGADHLTVAQLESLGPGLVIDEREKNGSRVIMWME
jgi:hypothetical protein